jgi:Fe-S-cluster containining protein
MKPLSEKQALIILRSLKDSFRDRIRQNYEHRAKDCKTCETQGACCLDTHFVNVHITRLEAVSIRDELRKLPVKKQVELTRRISETIEKYDLKSEGDTFSKTFACPLFEKGVGCLVHSVKPLPCIAHACYERREDLPPDDLQAEAETKIEKLNEQTYKKFPRWLSLPVWLDLIDKNSN